MKKETNQRREAIGKLFKSILKIGSTQDNEKGEKGRFLTANGELIELDRELIESKGVKKKTTNQDIIDWSNQIKS